MLLFWKLVDETQMGNPCENTARDILSKFSTPQSHLLYIISLWDTLYTSNKLWIFMNFYQDWVFRKKQVKQNFIIRFSWKDAVSSKVCKKITIPAPAIVCLSLNSTPDNLDIQGLLMATFFWAFSLEIFFAVETLYTMMHDVI